MLIQPESAHVLIVNTTQAMMTYDAVKADGASEVIAGAALFEAEPDLKPTEGN
jgi:hypothetical protein